jgi:hypothetical protein
VSVPTTADINEVQPKALVERPEIDPVTLAIVPWDDPVFARRGHDPRDHYVERFWLPILGPSTTWLLRRFARGFDEMPGGFRVDLADTSRALGLGEGTGRHSMISRSVDRACQFGMAQRHGIDRVAVRTHMPPLSQRQLKRLPLALQHAHERLAEQERERRTDLRIVEAPPAAPTALRRPIPPPPPTSPTAA